MRVRADCRRLCRSIAPPNRVKKDSFGCLPGPECMYQRKFLTLGQVFVIIEGFALKEAWLSAQSEAQRVVRGGDDGSKTDSLVAGFGWLQEYKLGILK